MTISIYFIQHPNIKGDNYLKNVSLMNQVIVFLGKLVGDLNENYGRAVQTTRSDKIKITDIYAKLKQIEVKLKKN